MKAALAAQTDRSLHYYFRLVLFAMVGTVAVDALIAPARLFDAIVLKSALVGLPVLVGLRLPPDYRSARMVLLGLSLIAFGAATTLAASWSPLPDKTFHMLGMVLILAIAAPGLPYDPRQSAQFIVGYALVCGATLGVTRGFDITALAVLGVLILTGIAGWFVARRLWQLMRENLELVDLRGQQMEELARANRDLQQLASHDPLTGLANRRQVTETFAQQYGDAGIAGRNHVAVLLLDLDHFKTFNDRHGHQNGDVCLRAVSDTLAHAARQYNGIAARFGGEEFVVVLRVESPLAAKAAAEDMRVAIERIEMALGENRGTVACTASIGVAIHSGNGKPDLSRLLAAADGALYAAKDGGRNRVEVAQDVLDRV